MLEATEPSSFLLMFKFSICESMGAFSKRCKKFRNFEKLDVTEI